MTELSIEEREPAQLSIEERVAAGAKWLDENRPGWMEGVDLEALDLSDPRLCILGQTFGNYWTSDPVRAAAGGDPEVHQNAVAALGFNATWKPLAVHELPEGRELTAEWRRLIESRRAS